MKDKLDRLYPQLVKGRNCYFCGKPAENMHHIVPRSNILLRWDLKNLLPVCYNCHQALHNAPHDITLYIGLVRSAYLEEMRQMNFQDYLRVHNLTRDEFYKVKEFELKGAIK